MAAATIDGQRCRAKLTYSARGMGIECFARLGADLGLVDLGGFDLRFKEEKRTAPRFVFVRLHYQANDICDDLLC